MYDDDWDDEPGPQASWFDRFMGDGLITEVLHQLRSGKEATVYVCRAGPGTGQDLLAAKVHRDRQRRSFRNDAVYLQGRSFGKHRETRAVRTKTRFGREVQSAAWLASEHETLERLWREGADVPAPVASGPGAMLMRYLGDPDGAAPQLREVRLSPGDAREAFDRLLWNVERFLSVHVVHGDLSAYNVLWWEDRPWVIDVPQAVDARKNRGAHELLERDVANLCRHFRTYGIDRDPERLASSLWHRYLLGRI